jgi:hypothetical protein
MINQHILLLMVVLPTVIRGWMPRRYAKVVRSFPEQITSVSRSSSSINPIEQKQNICRTFTCQYMSLIPLPVEDLEELLMVGSPSGQQYATYWGRTKREKYNQLVESAIVALIGTFFSYFLSFVVGGLVSTIIGTMFFFWAILSPDFKARQRNWEFLGGRPF